jgi:hypothetical protein
MINTNWGEKKKTNSHLSLSLFRKKLKLKKLICLPAMFLYTVAYYLNKNYKKILK